MDEQLIESIIKEAKSPLRMFRRLVTRELNIPPIAHGQVIDQLVSSWEKAQGDKEHFLGLIESATATQNFGRELLIKPNLSDAIDIFKGE